ncbi:YceI family protein [Yeosuana marina]|uniref:YceI family protein n=1 Tax=Yeosuana marina TaxID=1565536 RepID=UPI00142112BA|nr:YceI family protein [Yeosuana marina]|tara:strand:- start:340 stop:921 length:582 start_codon:yes stop_codon:yes gene_type:complete
MKTHKISTRILSLIILLTVTFNLTQAQEFKLLKEESSLKIMGTSSIHDWHEVAEDQSGKINFNNLETGQIEKININIVAESLKSGKRGMDKNTYKALKTDKYKTISFQLTEVKKTISKDNGVFDVNAIGDLTIAGVKKTISLDFTLSVTDSKIKLTGEKKIKMTEFNIEPPTALFGTITTGDEITVEFSTIFK